MKTARKRTKDPSSVDPKSAEKLAILIDVFDAALGHADTEAFVMLFFLQPHERDWIVRRLLEGVSRTPGPSRQEKIIIFMGRFAIAGLVRAYLNPCPGLDQSRVTELILSIVDNTYAPPEDRPGIITADILLCVPQNNRAAIAELLDRIAKHHVNDPWADQTPTNGGDSAGSTLDSTPSNQVWDVWPVEFPWASR
jgi:hypothetical protein